MKSPATPPNEAERLAALRALEILDTPREERFDRLTRLARRLFDVPVALVSLVDADRQWFKSADGFCFAETPRDSSFCAHAILEDDLLVVSDALQDQRFSDNPFVVDGPRVRFYAGCPLTLSGGVTLGTVCLMDNRPRDFDAEDRRSLRDIGQLVVRELIAYELATTDELTGIPNRRAFMGIAQHALNVCRRARKPALLAYFDLDNFKTINDRFGHAEGDRALVEFSAALRGVGRETDVVARLGGDEFVALFVDTDTAQAAALAQRLRDELDRARAAASCRYPIEFSVGEVEYDAARHASVRHMLEEADSAMYVAKRSA
ncbi:GGDEF domain-containing protein [Paraburkholderia caballeronis]|uniref:Diguanylate cyclase (GGDEF) domain-containing protein n=1 Tax=Paraburkholderia caballeronis TaxID=416943 RepID=A0A1H7NRW9_9BURK|nr:sensor domain-containing diguanylate cyclase [Paraburkholderia caballeronis]PXW25564.1 diguanylate cyclase with GAF sensor [Paraburkholderia caballeronis]PXX01171.1 diguanylate cyclase with GAF sensor [Paraburkholderia caballeronis]RAJ99476.1 diguanylate cyclase with GAF sensor [Paraburkholderia caballeronis]TDV07188.1 diguanylate cyclase with GAF sensor [Paraburkholderia caballeronis]TDV11332.1 diguanylate cyclase with GAF sensor [Paraburkholderia caballeronis]